MGGRSNGAVPSSRPSMEGLDELRRDRALQSSGCHRGEPAGACTRPTDCFLPQKGIAYAAKLWPSPLPALCARPGPAGTGRHVAVVGRSDGPRRLLASLGTENYPHQFSFTTSACRVPNCDPGRHRPGTRRKAVARRDRERTLAQASLGQRAHRLDYSSGARQPSVTAQELPGVICSQLGEEDDFPAGRPLALD